MSNALAVLVPFYVKALDGVLRNETVKQALEVHVRTELAIAIAIAIAIAVLRLTKSIRTKLLSIRIGQDLILIHIPINFQNVRTIFKCCCKH